MRCANCCSRWLPRCSRIAAVAADQPAAPATTYLLKADRVFDARSEATHAGWAVLVVGDKIAAVGPAARSTRHPARR